MDDFLTRFQATECTLTTADFLNAAEPLADYILDFSHEWTVDYDYKLETAFDNFCLGIMLNRGLREWHCSVPEIIEHKIDGHCESSPQLVDGKIEVTLKPMVRSVYGHEPLHQFDRLTSRGLEISETIRTDRPAAIRLLAVEVALFALSFHEDVRFYPIDADMLDALTARINTVREQDRAAVTVNEHDNGTLANDSEEIEPPKTEPPKIKNLGTRWTKEKLEPVATFFYATHGKIGDREMVGLIESHYGRKPSRATLQKTDAWKRNGRIAGMRTSAKAVNEASSQVSIEESVSLSPGDWRAEQTVREALIDIEGEAGRKLTESELSDTLDALTKVICLTGNGENDKRLESKIKELGEKYRRR